ncbi:MAG: hypothetical protein Q4A64_03330 [Porphyromonadaceae bacterium]|nr:hypothetical protein [Porphyromonadaceae bacterium]
MARRRTRQPNQRKAYQAHQRRVSIYTLQIERIYQQLIAGGVQLVDTLGGLSDNHIADKAMQRLVRAFALQVMETIRVGVMSEWQEASKVQDELARRVFGATYPDKYVANRPEAVEEFVNRKTGGLNLSDRVWRTAKQAQAELSTALEVGLSDGLSAQELSREVKKYLQAPDKLFRRVRGEEGDLKLSKRAKAYNPGEGIYRSSHKNAMRLTRTEINMAYRRSEQARWQAMDFVVGYEVKRSGTGYDCPVCDALAGQYPKDFVWATWHPHCRCYAIPILKTEQELFDKPDKPSINEVKEPHEGFLQWVEEQRPRLLTYQQRGTLPIFIKENKQSIRLLKGEAWSKIDEVGSLMSRAKDISLEVQGIASEVANKFRAKVTPINLKSRASIERKMKSEGATASDIKDAVRTTIIAPKEEINNIVQELRKREGFLRHKEQTPDKFLGYSGNIINMRGRNGLTYEVQVNTPEMIYAKELPNNAKKILGEDIWIEINKRVNVDGGLGHKIYEQIRILDIHSDIDLYEKLKKKSEQYYSLFQ